MKKILFILTSAMLSWAGLLDKNSCTIMPEGCYNEKISIQESLLSVSPKDHTKFLNHLFNLNALPYYSIPWVVERLEKDVLKGISLENDALAAISLGSSQLGIMESLNFLLQYRQWNHEEICLAIKERLSACEQEQTPEEKVKILTLSLIDRKRYTDLMNFWDDFRSFMNSTIKKDQSPSNLSHDDGKIFNELKSIEMFLDNSQDSEVMKFTGFNILKDYVKLMRENFSIPFLNQKELVELCDKYHYDSSGLEKDNLSNWLDELNIDGIANQISLSMSIWENWIPKQSDLYEYMESISLYAPEVYTDTRVFFPHETQIAGHTFSHSELLASGKIKELRQTKAEYEGLLYEYLPDMGLFYRNVFFNTNPHNNWWSEIVEPQFNSIIYGVLDNFLLDSAVSCLSLLCYSLKVPVSQNMELTQILALLFPKLAALKVNKESWSILVDNINSDPILASFVLLGNIQTPEYKKWILSKISNKFTRSIDKDNSVYKSLMKKGWFVSLQMLSKHPNQSVKNMCNVLLCSVYDSVLEEGYKIIRNEIIEFATEEIKNNTTEESIKNVILDIYGNSITKEYFKQNCENSLLNPCKDKDSILENLWEILSMKKKVLNSYTNQNIIQIT